jgi:aspartyl protease family protein
MQLKHVLPLFLIAIAIGWFMPSDGSSQLVIGPTEQPVQIIKASAPAEQRAPSLEKERANDIPQIAPDKITLNRAVDGHFYADLDVNYGKVRFLVDTGASMVALTGDDAQKLGLTWNDVELETIARGASGDVRGKLVMIDKMQIGNFQANNVRAAIIPQGLDVSLLGQSFLARVGSVNIQNDKMVWN